jgi:hypothetical protein
VTNKKTNIEKLQPPKMNARILIVEGTSGIGKSTLIDGLLRKYLSENSKIRSLLHLTQANTYGPLAIDEDQNTLTKEMNKAHLDNIYNLLFWSASSLKNERKIKFFGIIDTLHLTHCVRPGVIGWSDIRDFDAKLKNIECRLIFISAEPQTIWNRGIMPRIHDQFITGYGKKFGKDIKEIHQYFIREQIQIEKLVSNSQLDKIHIQAENDLESNIEKSYNFWLS